MLNHLTIMGRLVADPELRTTQSGIPVTSFRIAVERNYANQDNERETDFFDVTAWRGTAEVVCKYFTKGRMVAIDGRLETQAWTDRDGNNRVSVGIVAESVYFADSKREESKPKSRSTGKGRKAA
jgi:single-strand DNA-binding protein